MNFHAVLKLKDFNDHFEGSNTVALFQQSTLRLILPNKTVNSNNYLLLADILSKQIRHGATARGAFSVHRKPECFHS